jgi:ABC-2 type transport system ATP-binding protein
MALREISFSVKRGAITGLIGPNGAGKTTTIKVILGLLRPDAGEVKVLEKNPWNNPKVMERIGVVQEKPNFPKSMKIGDYLQRVARMRGVPETRAIELLKNEGLGAALDRSAGKLSAGMTQRFALVHALIHDPDIVVADEPTSNLDPQARAEVLDSITRLNREKQITFLISSHLLPELSRVCDTAAIMSNGQVVASGNLQQLYGTFKSQAARITTNKATELGTKIKYLEYVVRVEISGDNIVVETKEGLVSRLYKDVPQVADDVGAELYGIESKGASLEELFRKTVSSPSASNSNDDDVEEN